MTGRNRYRVAVLALVASGLAAPGALEAQERPAEEGWWGWAVAEVLAGQEIRTTDGRRVVIDPDARSGRDRDRRGPDGRAPGIPAFCRTGEGHPVFGRDWCIEKGFGLGSGGWRRVGIDDIIFRRAPRRDGVILDRSGVEDVLGDIILGRLLDEVGGT